MTASVLDLTLGSPRPASLTAAIRWQLQAVKAWSMAVEMGRASLEKAAADDMFEAANWLQWWILKEYAPGHEGASPDDDETDWAYVAALEGSL